MQAHILCAHPDGDFAHRLRKSLEQTAPLPAFEHFLQAEALYLRAKALAASGEEPAIVLSSIDLQADSGIDLLTRIHNSPPLQQTRKILIATPEEISAADPLLQIGALHGRLDPNFDNATPPPLLQRLL
ncbi:MAG: hypothetical protein ACK5LK_08365, partial [Chthoniobacterales bacterium]